MDLRLRPLRENDEGAFRIAHEAMAAEGFGFGLGYAEGMEWSRFLAAIDSLRVGNDLPDGLVPATFLAADVRGEIVGRTSIRHRLNDFLAREGGHIGYCVLPEHRRRGYASEILRQSLVIARALGIDAVLITCDDTNIGSGTVIERCGGQFDSLVETESGSPKRRYWIR